MRLDAQGRPLVADRGAGKMDAAAIRRFLPVLSKPTAKPSPTAGVD
jgi:hypothetical protein